MLRIVVLGSEFLGIKKYQIFKMFFIKWINVIEILLNLIFVFVWDGQEGWGKFIENWIIYGLLKIRNNDVREKNLEDNIKKKIKMRIMFVVCLLSRNYVLGFYILGMDLRFDFLYLGGRREVINKIIK